MQQKDEPPKLLKAIAEALCDEMLKQGLWLLSPKFLGYDWNSWYERVDGNHNSPVYVPAASNKGNCLDNNRIKIVTDTHSTLTTSLNLCPDAFKELLFDCYINVIIQQLEFLQAQIKLHNNIDRLVFQNIHFFVTKLRKKADPVGYAIAQNTKNAIQAAIALNVITANKLKINNKTLLTFSSLSDSTILSRKNALSKTLRNNKRWTKEFLLELSKQNNTEEVKELFVNIICQLKQFGISRFYFKDLVDAVKEDVRAIVKEELAIVAPDYIGGTARYEQDNEGDNERVLFILPDDIYENYEVFIYWCEQIRKAIDQSNYQDRVHKQLERMFTEIEMAIGDGDDPPSQSEIARRLHIPIATLNGYMNKLRQLVDTVKVE